MKLISWRGGHTRQSVHYERTENKEMMGGGQIGRQASRQIGRQAGIRERERGMHLLCMSARRRSSYVSRNLLISFRSFSHFLRFAVVTDAHQTTSMRSKAKSMQGKVK